MTRIIQMLNLVVTLTLFQFCRGQHADSGDVVQIRPSSAGSRQLRSVSSDAKQPEAQTRRGSLAFKFDQKASPGLHNLMEAKLKNMNPSVQCGDNLMTLQVKRVRAPHFLVDSGETPLTPLSQMPSECGFTVKRSRRDVHITAPYQGCNVAQQGGNYVLPLRLWGAPMTMSCPVVLPPPSVSCFPSGMVVKIDGFTANELKVKVSGVWMPLTSVCNSCGLAVEELFGGLVLTAPYNRGLCVEIKDEKYLLSLLLVDVELSVTCPSLMNMMPTTTTTTPPSDSGQVLQYPQFPQYPVFPGPPPPAHTPTPATSTAAPLPQRPQLPSGAATDSENQEAPAAPHPAFTFMSQYPQFPQYLSFPKPLPPTQSTADKNTAAPPAQLPQVPQSPQYPYPFFPQIPIVPGMFHPAAPPPSPPPPAATSTGALVTTPAPTTEHDGKPHVPQQPQFPVPPQYPFQQFQNLPLLPVGQTIQDPKAVIQQPKPQQAYPQTYQIPVLYPPTAAPATTTTAATTLKPAAQKPFYYPHLYMPAYYVPQQAPMPVFPDLPSTPQTNPAPSDQQGQQQSYRAFPPFHPFFSHQRPKLAAGNA